MVNEHNQQIGPVSAIDYRGFARSFLAPSDCSRQHALYETTRGQVDFYRGVLTALPETNRRRADAIRGLDETLRIYHRLIYEQNELIRQSSQTPIACRSPASPEVCACLRALGWDPTYPEGYALLQGSDPALEEQRALWRGVVNASGQEPLKAQLEGCLR